VHFGRGHLDKAADDPLVPNIQPFEYVIRGAIPWLAAGRHGQLKDFDLVYVSKCRLYCDVKATLF